MKRLLVGTLGLSLGWFTGAAAAEELSWHPAPKRTAAPQNAPQGPPVMAVSLGRPVALSEPAEAVTDPVLRPASFTTLAPANPGRVVRAQSADSMPQRLPDVFDLKIQESPPAKALARTHFGGEAETVSNQPVVIEPDAREPVAVPAPPPGGKEPAAEVIPAEPAPPPNQEMGPQAQVAPFPRPEIISSPSTEAVHSPTCDTACPGEWKAAHQCCPAPAQRLYAQGEYLLWWLRDTRVPPLITTGPVSSQGILGRAGTAILLGGSPLNNEDRSGGRLTAGYWLDDCQNVGIEGSFFFLGDRTVAFPFNSNQFALLARPFFNLNLGQEDAQIGVVPGISTGSITTALASQLWGAGGDFRANLCRGCNYRVDLLGGFRYLDLKESLQITEDLTVLPTSPTFAGSHIVVSDRFATHNHFYAAEIGTVAEYHWGRWSADLRARIGLGNTHQVVDINGSQVITGPTGSVTAFQGGLLALPTNIGRTTRDHFTVVPEVGLNVGYQITDRLRAFVGYDFLYWSHVLRPGDQIDRGLDVTLIPNFSNNLTPTGLVRPAVPLKETGFWAQGVSAGLEFRY